MKLFIPDNLIKLLNTKETLLLSVQICIEAPPQNVIWPKLELINMHKKVEVSQNLFKPATLKQYLKICITRASILV